MNHGGAALTLTAKMSGMAGVHQGHPQMDIPRRQPNWLPSQVWRLHSDSLDTRLLLELHSVVCVCVLYPIPRSYASVPVRALWHFVMTPLGTDHCLKVCLRAASTHICTRCGRQVFTGQHSGSQTPQSGSSSLFSTPSPDPSLGTERFPLTLESLLHCHTFLTPFPLCCIDTTFKCSPKCQVNISQFHLQEERLLPQHGLESPVGRSSLWSPMFYARHIEPKHITAHLTPASGTPPATSEPCCAAWGLSSSFPTCSTSSSLTLQTQ